MDLNEIKDKIISKLNNQYVKSIAIITHLSPDGDAIGSSVALAEVLKLMNKNVDIIIPSYSSNFNKLLKNVNVVKHSKKSYDVTILLDCSSRDRTIYQVDDLSKFLIVIDHHIDNHPIGNLYLCEDKASTTIILYNLFRQMNIKINSLIATALYAGIIGDTSYFSNTNISMETYQIASMLLKYGANLELINNLFQIKKYETWKLIAEILSNSILDKKYKIIYAVILQDDLEKYNLSYDIVNFIMRELKNIKEADIAFLFLESKNDTKVKVRSRGVGSMNKIMQYFNGGGHKFAAGASIDSLNIYSVVDSVISRTKLYINEHPEEFKINDLK